MFERRYPAALVTRAVALLLIVSPVSAALAGSTADSTAALVSDGAVTTAVDADDYDERLTSERTYWRGQGLYFDGSNVVENVGSAPAAERTFQIRRVVDGDEVGTLVSEFVVDADGERAISTGGLSDRFVITYEGDPVHVRDGVGYVGTTPGGTSVSVANSRWEVTTQTLSVRWDDDSIPEGGTSTLEVNSNRGSFRMEVSARGLDFEDLRAMFPQSAYADDFDELSDDDVIVLQVTDGAAIEADFEGVEPGVYTFEVEVADTAARAGGSAAVASSRGTVGFDGSVVSEEAGDIARFEVELRRADEAYLIVGGPDVNLLDVLRVEDRDGDGTVVVEMNTRYVGLNPDDPGVPRDIRAYTATDGRIDVYDGGDFLGTGRTLDDVRRDLGIDRDGLSRPIQPGEYDLSLASSDRISASRGSLDVADERDIGSLVLSRPSVRSVGTFAAPAGANTRDVDRLESAMEPASRVVMGDLAVVRVEASGIYGYLDAEGGGVGTLIDNEDEGLDLLIEQADGAINRPSNRIDLRQDAVRFLVDEERNRLYVVMDTDRLRTPRSLESSPTIRASFTTTGVDDDLSRYDLRSGNPAAHAGYPYLSPGREQSASAEFDVRSASTRVDRGDGEVRLSNTRGVRVSGTTNLAPGSEIVVRVRGRSGATIAERATTTVGGDGTWRATLDLSAASVGDRFALAVSRGGETLTEVDGVIVARSTPEETPTETERPPEETPEGTPTETDEPAEPTPTETDTATPTPTETPSGQPGFGVAALLAALVALYAVRRRRST